MCSLKHKSPSPGVPLHFCHVGVSQDKNPKTCAESATNNSHTSKQSLGFAFFLTRRQLDQVLTSSKGRGCGTTFGSAIQEADAGCCRMLVLDSVTQSCAECSCNMLLMGVAERGCLSGGAAQGWTVRGRAVAVARCCCCSVLCCAGCC